MKWNKEKKKREKKRRGNFFAKFAKFLIAPISESDLIRRHRLARAEKNGRNRNFFCHEIRESPRDRTSCLATGAIVSADSAFASRTVPERCNAPKTAISLSADQADSGKARNPKNETGVPTGPVQLLPSLSESTICRITPRR